MSLNQTPSSERVHIGFFGRRNAGKSSIVNAVTGQELAVVSAVKGTTTDPVQKAMELLPLGPVVIIDTPGIDDEGKLGAQRVKKTKQILNKTDAAVLVVDVLEGKKAADEELLALFAKKGIPALVVYNKADLVEAVSSETEAARTVCRSGERPAEQAAAPGMKGQEMHPVVEEIYVSARTGDGVETLKTKLASLLPQKDSEKRIVGDLIEPGDFVVLVVPIDKAAPKGRLILPQQQTLRDLLDADAVSIVVKENRLKETLAQLGQAPSLVITDSQVFERVAADTPDDVMLTSFSILFARYKGNLQALVQGAAVIDQLADGDSVLISEGCTHHRQCQDIGSVKLPGWLRAHTHKQLQIVLSSGTEFPEDLTQFRLIIHCGGCMLNEREMQYRLGCAADAGVPMTNYGIAIAYLKGILQRSIKPFSEIRLND